MTDYDSAYKNLFAHPELVVDLLRGFVHEEWVEQIDLTTLERVNSSYVADDLRDRSDDLIWRVKCRHDWIYIYLLLEFQSRVDPYMALRIMVYIGLLYQDLLKSRTVTATEKLPPVFPIVIYNGEAPWSAALEVADLIEEVPRSLTAYRPKQRYFLLDEGRISEAKLPQQPNTVAEIIRLEATPQPEELRAIIARLTQQVGEPHYDSLRRALVVWLNRIVLRRLTPKPVLHEFHDLQEIDQMLAERVTRWTEEWMQAGLQKGLAQGLEQGRVQGLELGQRQAARHFLKRQLVRRFGVIPAVVEEQLNSATVEQLEEWGDRLLEAQSLDAIFTHS